MIKILQKKKLPQFIERLSQKYQIAAPVAVENDAPGQKKDGANKQIEYRYVEDFSRVQLDRQPDKSPKNILLPQNEKLGTEIKLNNGSSSKEENTPEKTLIFGVRTCDIEAIGVLDSVFIGEDYVDPYYENKREQTVIFGYSCRERHSSCFCDTLGFDPVKNDKVPVTIYEEEDHFWFEIHEKEYENLFADLDTGDEEELNTIIESRSNSFEEDRLELDLQLPLSEKQLFSTNVWNEIAAGCLNCGICTYYCPTCYCFGFFWDKEEQKSEKWRKWDSCMFTLFTKHASGHNPRETKGQRYRQRLMHKFSYHPQNYGDTGCVGCGRCLDKCPVNLDIREALNTVHNHLKREGEAVTDDR